MMLSDLLPSAAMVLGCALMAAGGVALTAGVVWKLLEIAVRYTGHTRTVISWYRDRLRRERGGPQQ